MEDLDHAIIRLAAEEARRNLSAGCVPTEAVKRATPGAWAQFRGAVLDRLLDEAARRDGRTL